MNALKITIGLRQAIKQTDLLMDLYQSDHLNFEEYEKHTRKKVDFLRSFIILPFITEEERRKGTTLMNKHNTIVKQKQQATR